jgi:hypothetical protein
VSYFPSHNGRTILKFRPSPVYCSPVQNTWRYVNRLDFSRAWKDTALYSPWNMWHASTHTTFFYKDKMIMYLRQIAVYKPTSIALVTFVFGNRSCGMWCGVVQQMCINDSEQRAPPKRRYHLPDYTTSHSKDRRETLFLYLYFTSLTVLLRAQNTRWMTSSKGQGEQTAGS